ncbi:MAG: Propeptide, PepSY amd peptidase [Ramlibacter sp.]|nr:Propeptide, PepSY amd peptidase [Ramlibacter sp.]
MKTFAKLISACLLVAAGAAWADIGRDDAAAIAQRSSGGRVLTVERADSGGRPVWRVKVVTPNGDVRVILLDVASGRPV